MRRHVSSVGLEVQNSEDTVGDNLTTKQTKETPLLKVAVVANRR